MDKKKARVALRKSIKHWCIDIRKPMIDGDTILYNYWIKGDCKVKMFSDSCNLCMIYNSCRGCPLVRADMRCDDGNSIYMAFYNNHDINSASNMIAALIEAYKEVL